MELVRLNVNLNKETAAALKKYAAEHDVTLTEAIRRAIAILTYVDEQVTSGRKVLTMDQDDRNKRELVMM